MSTESAFFEFLNIQPIQQCQQSTSPDSTDSTDSLEWDNSMLKCFLLSPNPKNLNGIFDLCDDEKKRDTSQITRVSEFVKEQFVKTPYAKISISQQIAAGNNSDRLICGFTNHVIPKDVTGLICAYYPSFYYNDEFISLQSNHKNANIFVISKECCPLSGYLSNQCASSSIVKVDPVDDNILELFVKYIANKYDKGLCECKSPMEEEYFEALCKEWNKYFASLILNEEDAQKLLDFAKRMDCESLIALTERELHVREMRKKHMILIRQKMVEMTQAMEEMKEREARGEREEIIWPYLISSNS